jgi:hypothetical protein
MNQFFNSENLTLFGLMAEYGSGKDEVARILCEHGFQRFAFGDKVRESSVAIDPYVCLDPAHLDLECTQSEFMSMSEHLGMFSDRREGWCPFIRLSEYVREFGWDEAKKNPDVRRTMQRVGTEGGREIHGEDCWVRFYNEEIYHHEKALQPRKIVVTDVRFDNEQDAIRFAGGKLVAVVGRRLKESVTRKHASEQLAAKCRESADIVIENTGDLEHLKKEVYSKLLLLKA